MEEFSKNTRKYLTLEQYEVIARKILNKNYPKISNWITRDNDRFGDVVNAVMMADHQWDENRGTLVGYRKQRVVWCVRTMLHKEKKNRTISLNYAFNDSTELLDTIPDIIGPDLVEYGDKLEVLRNKVEKSSVLTEREKLCIGQYFSNVSLDTMCENLSISKECIKLTIRRGLGKMGKIE